MVRAATHSASVPISSITITSAGGSLFHYLTVHAHGGASDTCSTGEPCKMLPAQPLPSHTFATHAWRAEPRTRHVVFNSLNHHAVLLLHMGHLQCTAGYNTQAAVCKDNEAWGRSPQRLQEAAPTGLAWSDTWQPQPTLPDPLGQQTQPPPELWHPCRQPQDLSYIHMATAHLHAACAAQARVRDISIPAHFVGRVLHRFSLDVMLCVLLRGAPSFCKQQRVRCKPAGRGGRHELPFGGHQGFPKQSRKPKQRALTTTTTRRWHSSASSRLSSRIAVVLPTPGRPAAEGAVWWQHRPSTA